MTQSNHIKLRLTVKITSTSTDVTQKITNKISSMENKYFRPCYNQLGDKNGDCCCNCKHQFILRSHPSNNICSGKSNEISGFRACLAEHLIDNNYYGTIFDHRHGLCELHERKPMESND